MPDSKVLINSGYMTWEQIEKENLVILEKRLGLDGIHQRLTKLENDGLKPSLSLCDMANKLEYLGKIGTIAYDTMKTHSKEIEEVRAAYSWHETVIRELKYKVNLLENGLKNMIPDDSLESQIEDLEEQLEYKRNLLALRNKNE